MTQAKSSFKSTPFFAVMILVIIALASGLILSVLSDVLFIDENERIKRDIANLYQAESVVKLELQDEFAAKDEFGEIVYVLKADDVVIIKAKGNPGYKGSSEVVMAIKDNKIMKMVISTFGGDNVTSTVNQDYLDSVYAGHEITEDLSFYLSFKGYVTDGTVDVTGSATSKKTMRSVRDAANMAIYYYNNAKTDIFEQIEAINNNAGGTNA